mmetsp:Transcript_130232/g.278283  ORF Transcript_130232/g.278283 Transcript_130232/m.278283 type:complete len:236 (+) Transcript_130232:540-1247(+)
MPDLLITSLQSLRDGLPQLPEGDSALHVFVHAEEMFADLGALVIGERPCQHVTAATAELRRLAETAQRLLHARINLTSGSRTRRLHMALQPRMLEGGLGCEALLGVHLQQGEHKVLGPGRDLLPAIGTTVELPVPDGIFYDLVTSNKWHSARDEDESDHPHAPEITLARVIPLEDLRAHVGHGPAMAMHPYPRLAQLGEAEIAELQMATTHPVVEEILELHVTVHHALGVDVIHC